METRYGLDPVAILTENLYKEMDRLEVRELIVVGVHADTEEETGVSSVDDLVVPELEHTAMRTGKEGRVGIVNVRAARSGLISGDTEGERRCLPDAPRQSWIGTFGL